MSKSRFVGLDTWEGHLISVLEIVLQRESITEYDEEPTQIFRCRLYHLCQANKQHNWKVKKIHPAICSVFGLPFMCATQC